MSRGDQLFWFDVDVFADALAAACADTEKIVLQSIYSTMGKLRSRSKTKLSSEIRDRWNIKKKDLDGKIRVKAGKGGRSYEGFEMVIKGTSLSLSYFGAKQYSGSRVTTSKSSRVNKRRSKFQGVQVEVKKGKKISLSNAFMQAAGSGHVMVLRRKGKERYPLEMKAVISPASMFMNDAFNDRFTDQVLEDMESLFAHELDWRLKRAGLI